MLIAKCHRYVGLRVSRLLIDRPLAGDFRKSRQQIRTISRAPRVVNLIVYYRL